MKASSFNRTFPDHDKYPDHFLLYNARSNALVRVTEDLFHACQQMLEHPDDVAEKDQDLADNLRTMGFIVEDDLDEVAVLEQEYRQARKERRFLFLTILPTLSCNFRCSYCYAAKGPAHLDAEKINRIKAWVTRLMDERPWEFMAVDWIGGEPLLNLPAIRELSADFLAQCGRRGIPYLATLTTNGYGLTTPCRAVLREAQVKRVHVALDGPRLIHDGLRPHRAGRGTFDRIITNLREMLDDFEIILRLQLLKENAGSMPDLLRELAAAGLADGRVQIYFGKISPYTASCFSVADRAMSTEQFSETEAGLMREAERLGFRIEKFPPRRPVYCSADIDSATIIDPDLYLYRCINDAGNPQEAFGQIGVDERNERGFTKYASWSPFDQADCRRCSVLPICLGGCPYKSVVMQRLKNRGHCDTYRDNLEDYLRGISASREQGE